MFELSKMSAYDYLQRNATLYGEKLFLETEKERYVWRETADNVFGLCAYFTKKGLRKGTDVLFRVKKDAESVNIYFAFFVLGVVIIPVDPHRSTEDFLRENDNIESKYSVDSDDKGYFIKIDEQKEYLPKKYSFTPDDFVPQNNVYDDAVIIFTSGSTGRQKGVVLSQFSLLNNSRQQGDLCGVTEDSKCIFLTPLHHAFGLAALMARLTNAAAMFLPDDTSPECILNGVQRHKCTILDSVPTLYLLLAEEQKRNHYDLSTLKSGVIAGGPYTFGQFEEIEKTLGLRLCPSYGMSETSTLIAGANVSDSFELRSSGSGPVAEGGEILLKKDGKICERGEEGEVCVKGYMLMKGYYKAPEATQEVIDKDGFFHTGDMGYLDENNSLHITGRIKDIIIHGGEKLSPQKIENVISQIKGVGHVCVVGVENSIYGENVGVALTGDITEEELEGNLQGKLSSIEMPSLIVKLSSIPLLSSGKPDKTAIKKLLNEIKK